jgi:hypothetical protein
MIHSRMLFLIISWTFICIIAIIISKDGFLNREYYKYNLCISMPYLYREFITESYPNWIEYYHENHNSV